MQRAARCNGLDDFLGREGEEKHHRDVVDNEVESVGEFLVARLVDVRPYKRGDRACYQETRVIDEASHRSGGRL